MSNNAPPPQGGDFADIVGAPPPGQVAPQAELAGGFYGGTVSGEPFLQPDGRMTGPLALSPGSTGATYYQGDEFGILKGLTTEDRVRLQQQLVAVGLTSNPAYGELDDPTIKGMSKVLAMSNRAGTEWQDTLNRISTNPLLQEEAGGPAFDPPPYLQPDYATIAQEVKGFVQNRLGRDPDQGELAQLTSEWLGWDRQAHDVEVGAARQNFGNRQAEGEQSGGTFRQVDPMARFKEAFESKYANELDFVEDKETAVRSRQTVEQGTNTLSQMSRGA